VPRAQWENLAPHRHVVSTSCVFEALALSNRPTQVRKFWGVLRAPWERRRPDGHVSSTSSILVSLRPLLLVLHQHGCAVLDHHRGCTQLPPGLVNTGIMITVSVLCGHVVNEVSHQSSFTRPPWLPPTVILISSSLWCPSCPFPLLPHLCCF